MIIRIPTRYRNADYVMRLALYFLICVALGLIAGGMYVMARASS